MLPLLFSGLVEQGCTAAGGLHGVENEGGGGGESCQVQGRQKNGTPARGFHGVENEGGILQAPAALPLWVGAEPVVRKASVRGSVLLAVLEQGHVDSCDLDTRAPHSCCFGSMYCMFESFHH